mmetsp:Transcript_2875/g.6775  ORF Transcript_2875/g.6775 Transcript_2875/m.6775 type:complete len:214 (+) Transcript_2875:146-787(+)
MSGFSSTVIMLTVGSMRGGSGSCMVYFCRSHPTRMPSSMSVDATFSPRPTTNLAIDFTEMQKRSSSVPWSMIFVHRATCSGCSWPIICWSACRSHRAGTARPVSLSLTPTTSFTRFMIVFRSPSAAFSSSAYGPTPYVLSSSMSSSSSASTGASSSSSGSYSSSPSSAFAALFFSSAFFLPAAAAAAAASSSFAFAFSASLIVACANDRPDRG